MAEDDWYGPFAGWTFSHLNVLASATVGVFLTVTGAIGYDLSNRANPQWADDPVWGQIMLGGLAFGFAYWHYRVLKAESNSARN